ncbi:hypothetical protein PLEOSDRAFT_1108519 [Pleurotus ostreatus PC15]|uniref:Crinkler effector protein N-terminal domain-containing protein n=1 Tax=Pleurotus ostreatus (strain PC15) TaxID=1137138 RepID=A0A067NIY1_PLEO1|nr:hypothetical protein PLEOSDRAFT_1108519 [Pleurotus ostreatus PC15]
MSLTEIITINCLMAGDALTQIFMVEIALNTNISDLKAKIKEALPIALLAIVSYTSPHAPLGVPPTPLSDTRSPSGSALAAHAWLLQLLVKVSDVFDDLDTGKVHTEACPCMHFKASASSLSPATSAREDALNSDNINQYDAIFINVAAWGTNKHHFTNIDIFLNAIEEDQGPESSPTFVKDYPAKLDKKAGLSPEACKHFNAMDPKC